MLKPRGSNSNNPQRWHKLRCMEVCIWAILKRTRKTRALYPNFVSKEVKYFLKQVLLSSSVDLQLDQMMTVVFSNPWYPWHFKFLIICTRQPNFPSPVKHCNFTSQMSNQFAFPKQVQKNPDPTIGEKMMYSVFFHFNSSAVNITRTGNPRVMPSTVCLHLMPK